VTLRWAAIELVPDQARAPPPLITIDPTESKDSTPAAGQPPD